MNKPAILLLFLMILTLSMWIGYILCIYYNTEGEYIYTFRILSNLSTIIFILTSAYFQYKGRKKK